MTKSLDNIGRIDMCKKNNKNKVILISSGFWALLAHGMGLFNKYSVHDDTAHQFSVGATYSSGRWMLGVLDEAVSKLTGSTHYSTPLFNGTLSIIFIALICILVSMFLEINNSFLNIGLTGIMITFPVVTGLFGYMFTAPYYLFGTLTGVLGCYLLCKYSEWYFYLVGILLMACSVGVYQANIPICISVLLVYMIKKVIEQNGFEWKELFKFIMYYIVACVGFMSAYFIINKLFLLYKHAELSNYKGINNFGYTTITEYFRRIILAYKEFFNPTDDVSYNMFPFSLEVFYKVTIVMTIMLSAYIAYQKLRENILAGMFLVSLMILLPLAVNFIYVMCDVSGIHTLMMYGGVGTFVYFIWLVNYMSQKNPQFPKINQAVIILSATLILCINLLYCRFANICYLKADYVQKQAISYYTTLITRIKSVEGYTAQTRVVYINEYRKSDATIPRITQFEAIRISPYHWSCIINDYKWRGSMVLWCGFNPKTADSAMYEQLPEVIQMPCYPSDGSIKMIEDVLVVKFADTTTSYE